MKKLFVWDFHGVLETGNIPVVREITNVVLAEQGYDVRLSEEQNLRLYGRPWQEFFAELLPDEEPGAYDRLVDLAIHHPDKDTLVRRYVRATDHAVKVLANIAATHHQVLISNMSDLKIRMFLETVGLELFFDEEHALATVSSQTQTIRSKNEILAEYLGERELDELVAIGDSCADMRVTEVLAGTRYLYAHPGLAFRDCEADYKIRDLRDVLNAV